MIIRGVTVTGRMAVIFAFLFTVAACGGGGGGNDGFIADSGSSSKLKLKLVLLDTEGNKTETVTSAAAGILKVTASSSDIVVTTTTDIGLVFPASGTALTNSDGVATFQIEAGVERGAGTITSTAQNKNGETLTGTLAFQVGDSGLRLGYFDSDGDFIENEISIEPGSTLSSAGRAQITVAIVDENGQLARSKESVRLSSGCLASGQATLNPASPLGSGDGQVFTTYTAAGCSGTEQITASLVGASGQAFGSISIAPAEATGLTFVSATPSTIILRGIGGGSSDRQESSRVIFKVVDRNGTPVQSANIRFSLTTEVGGLSLSPEFALSGSDGLVGTTVFSGTVPTVVRVIATADDSGSEEVATVSDVLTVTTGLPDQNSFSVSVSGGFVVEDGMTIDGITRTITVRMADTYNNPVPDGTAALFTTEYGAIQPSCTTTGGLCSVQWNSQDPRGPSLDEGREAVRTIYSPGYNCPSHNGSSGACPDDLGYTHGGRSTILVTAIGQETFVDGNGNGIMDRDEQGEDRFDNLPEAFVDNNEDGTYTPALPACMSSPTGSAQCLAGFEEQFTDFNSNGRYDLNDDPAVYNGLLCPPEGDGIWCSRELVNVRDSTLLILSAGNDNWDILLVRGSTVVDSTTEGVTYTAYIADLFNNRPPAGSTVEVSAGGGCELISESSFEVANSAARGGIGITVETGGDGEAGTISITLKPKGDATSYTETFKCQSNPPPDPNDPGSGLGLGGG